ncbi:MAG TPA: malto-oligosyltrehalose synthase, partial [Bacteroidales bacterium]|nr:malto-oligosyltrehalose synthase [Bacteroidales bacterium]
MPSSTYRLQFNKAFTFKNLRQNLPFLISLGPGAIYASPVFRAVPGSNHGYDITDPLQINPEIGTIEEFNEVNGILRKKGIGWIQDIVPNHMAFHPDNYWLMDVLKMGRNSEYADFFDIDWDHPVYRDKIMVPILSESDENIIRKGELSLKYHNGDYFFNYNDFSIPVSPDSLKLPGNGSDVYELCDKVNSDPELMRAILIQQHYKLTHWQDVDQALNYRRFFTINGLICLRMEDPEVFSKYHELIFRMVGEGKFDGIRLDHVDGLKMPVEYFNRFRARAGNHVYIIAEKILATHENLDPYWPLQGTSGYDFLAAVNGLLTGIGVKQLTAFYKKKAGIGFETEEVIYSKKQSILKANFLGDLDNIYRQLTVSGLFRPSSVTTPEDFREALGEFMVSCPVYRLYGESFPLNRDDQNLIVSIIDRAIRNKPHLKTSLEAIKELFTSDDNINQIAVEPFLRIMQYTGPLMAKGIEDTAMYTWVSHIARNEVGDSIDAPVISIPEFHKKMIERRNLLPATINATATHDTKRGEDTRARLSVISDMPKAWISFYNEWSVRVNKYLLQVNGKSVPDENEKYFICQVILGALPMDGRPDVPFVLRLEEYLRKALREAKTNTTWNNPDLNYENAVIKFSGDILNDQDLIEISSRFFIKLREYGIINSLSQVVLKSMCPGIPDFYQGTELWDLSFVDPDNRRQVDYARHGSILKKLQKEMTNPGFFKELYKTRFQGDIKLWMIHRLMKERSSDPHAFVFAGYLPLEVAGLHSENLLAFARIYNEKWYVVIIPLHLASIREDHETNRIFDKTRINLPVHAPKEWESVWDNRNFKAIGNYIEGKLLQFSYPLVIKGK